MDSSGSSYTDNNHKSTSSSGEHAIPIVTSRPVQGSMRSYPHSCGHPAPVGPPPQPPWEGSLCPPGGGPTSEGAGAGLVGPLQPQPAAAPKFADIAPPPPRHAPQQEVQVTQCVKCGHCSDTSSSTTTAGATPSQQHSDGSLKSQQRQEKRMQQQHEALAGGGARHPRHTLQQQPSAAGRSAAPPFRRAQSELRPPSPHGPGASDGHPQFTARPSLPSSLIPVGRRHQSCGGSSHVGAGALSPLVAGAGGTVPNHARAGAGAGAWGDGLGQHSNRLILSSNGLHGRSASSSGNQANQHRFNGKGTGLTPGGHHGSASRVDNSSRLNGAGRQYGGGQVYGRRPSLGGVSIEDGRRPSLGGVSIEDGRRPSLGGVSLGECRCGQCAAAGPRGCQCGPYDSAGLTEYDEPWSHPWECEVGQEAHGAWGEEDGGSGGDDVWEGEGECENEGCQCHLYPEEELVGGARDPPAGLYNGSSQTAAASGDHGIHARCGDGPPGGARLLGAPGQTQGPAQPHPACKSSRQRRREARERRAQRSSSPCGGYSTDSSFVFMAPRKPYPKSDRKKQMVPKKSKQELSTQLEQDESIAVQA